MVAVKERREQVLALLTEKAVSSQQELLTLLAEAGVESTQPVLSRDLRALGAVKRGGRYVVLSAERVTRLEALRPLLRRRPLLLRRQSEAARLLAEWEEERLVLALNLMHPRSARAQAVRSGGPEHCTKKVLAGDITIIPCSRWSVAVT